ncbi:hypothetical protein SAMN02745673_04711 [Marinactinospora thermotolerans DSM 45154]|uniref:Uncharacterized protein n=1 Tax=Marinactinospora thermotolerans DSM 45154 TaxID=1122192 RepID=A0A1T4TAN6_9ACTN|nr:hypothetical protein SAMN02745673_04711 [Marinactinospora thermotolerans DSM 45154]
MRRLRGRSLRGAPVAPFPRVFTVAGYGQAAFSGAAEWPTAPITLW